MASELKLAYSSDSNIILYADAKSHLGHYGVVQWDADENFYRIRVVEEFVNDAKVLFVDYGSYEEIPKCDIFAVFESLTCFCKSPFGIRCKIDDVTLPLADWSKLILEKKIKVKIGKCVDGIFYVTLAEDPCNNFIAKVISTKVVQSSSGLFQVNIFWQPNRPSTSAMPDANSRVKVSCVGKQVSMA
jgi:tudor domain-containing protein 1/4/6/7